MVTAQMLLGAVWGALGAWWIGWWFARCGIIKAHLAWHGNLSTFPRCRNGLGATLVLAIPLGAASNLWTGTLWVGLAAGPAAGLAVGALIWIPAWIVTALIGPEGMTRRWANEEATMTHQRAEEE